MNNRSVRHRHPAALGLSELIKQCQVQHGRASGPGGQHRNKVQTAVTVRHRPTGVVGTGRERRSQAQNLRVAVARLRVNLALEVRCAVASNHQPSGVWQAHCIGGRVAVNVNHTDFPLVLAEALDVLASEHADVGLSAEVLGCTPSQLVKLLRSQPRAVAWLNQQRQQMGLGPLR